MKKITNLTVIKHLTLLFKKHTRLIILIAILGLLVAFEAWTRPVFSDLGTIKIYDMNDILLYESAGEVGKKTPILYEEIPQHLIDAVVASEDSTFWSNAGVEPRAMARALYQNIRNQKIVSGASTITQQLARASIISPNTRPPQTYLRKLREIFIALRINHKYSKEEILSHYLNQAYFGNQSFGIQAAAQTYFGKNASQLSLAESALLAGLLSSPEARNPFSNPELARQRQQLVLEKMVALQFINQEAASDALQDSVQLAEKISNIKAPHFVQMVLKEIDTQDIPKNKGISVYTTLDLPSYEVSERLARFWVNKLQSEHDLTNAALALIDNQSGAIRNLLGGVDYFAATQSGQVNMATALRQPGSAMKPITYAAAFMRGYTPASLIYDVPTVYTTKKGEGFSPNNYDGRYRGPVLVREALAASLNLPAVEMLNRIGIDPFLHLSREMGITTLTRVDQYDLALTLGGGEVTLLELANVYATFARKGDFLPTYSIEKIVSDTGKILYQHQSPPAVQVLGEHGEAVAYLISDILSDPKARITTFSEKNPLVLSRPAAVKTGTTTDWHDNWTIGYTPSYTVGVWVGNTDNQPMRNITGVVGAAPLWNQFFEEYLKQLPTESFVKPKEIIELEVCAISGLLPNELCPEIKTELFIAGTEPTQTSEWHKKAVIDTRNGLLATEDCSTEYTEEKIFVSYPAELVTWAVEQSQDIIPTQYSPFCNTIQSEESESFLTITYPKSHTTFETAPELGYEETIRFEVSASTSLDAVRWYLNNKEVGTSTTHPFRYSWSPIVGKYTLRAEGILQNKVVVSSKEVDFSVVEYQAETAN